MQAPKECKGCYLEGYFPTYGCDGCEEGSKKFIEFEITVKVKMKEFYPLFEMDENEELSDTVMWSLEDFKANLRDVIVDALEYDDIIDRHFDFWPDEWMSLNECADNLEITVADKKCKIP